MNERAVVVGVALLTLAGATAFFLGGFPAGGATANPAADNPTTVPVGSDSGGGNGGSGSGSNDGSGGGSGGSNSGDDAGSSGDSGKQDSGPGYLLTIDKIEKCGNTCRDVTATLKNTGGETRENVRVTTKVYAGDDKIWSGEEKVGTLDADETHTSTKRVKVGYIGGAKIKANDGYVTIVTIIESDSGTKKFSERRKVA